MNAHDVSPPRRCDVRPLWPLRLLAAPIARPLCAACLCEHHRRAHSSLRIVEPSRLPAVPGGRRRRHVPAEGGSTGQRLGYEGFIISAHSRGTSTDPTVMHGYALAVVVAVHTDSLSLVFVQRQPGVRQATAWVTVKPANACPRQSEMSASCIPGCRGARAAARFGEAVSSASAASVLPTLPTAVAITLGVPALAQARRRVVITW